jgi:hypothetical protein
VCHDNKTTGFIEGKNIKVIFQARQASCLSSPTYNNFLSEMSHSAHFLWKSHIVPFFSRIVPLSFGMLHCAFSRELCRFLTGYYIVHFSQELCRFLTGCYIVPFSQDVPLSYGMFHCASFSRTLHFAAFSNEMPFSIHHSQDFSIVQFSSRISHS